MKRFAIAFLLVGLAGAQTPTISSFLSNTQGNGAPTGQFATVRAATSGKALPKIPLYAEQYLMSYNGEGELVSVAPGSPLAGTAWPGTVGFGTGYASFGALVPKAGGGMTTSAWGN